MSERFPEIDLARGIALVCMVVFHFLLDLWLLGFIQISLYTGFWGVFQKLTAGTFLFLAGVCLTLSYHRHPTDWFPRFFRRSAFIGAGALLISGVTWVLFPKYWIYFGILHLMAVSTLLAIPFLKQKKANVVLGLALIALPAFIDLRAWNVPFLLWAGMAPPWPSFDFFPLIPWFGMVLLGMAFGNHFYPEGKPLKRWNVPEGPFSRSLAVLGKHSMGCYFIHQPILFAIIGLAAWFF
ncbi:MAG: DUF1624 domain-containing protein [Candidatus Diapherotrites archaeon]|nr:DUF1624 domain-containing protein [Candidatus Diapherotrites archaeon]